MCYNIENCDFINYGIYIWVCVYVYMGVYFFFLICDVCVFFFILVYKKELERDRKKFGELIFKWMMWFKLLIVYYSYNML